MPDVAKLIQLASIGGVFLERLLLKRFLLNVTALLLLSIVISVIVAGIVACAFYVIYWLMISHGVSITAALLITGGLAIGLIAILCLVAIWRYRRLHRTLTSALSLPFCLEEIVLEFINGLLAPTGE